MATAHDADSEAPPYKRARTAKEDGLAALMMTVFLRTYSRRVKAPSEEGGMRVETFAEAIDRVVTAATNQIHSPWEDPVKDPEDLRAFLLQHKASLAGRFLWQLGTGTVDALGMASLMNCNFWAVRPRSEDPDNWKIFGMVADMLMLGSGVGFSAQEEHVKELPPVLALAADDPGIVWDGIEDSEGNETEPEPGTHVVPDTREGWSELIDKTIQAYLVDGKGFTYTTRKIRPLGAQLKTFGGVASGPVPLRRAVSLIERVLKARAGKRLRSVDVVDIMNQVAQMVCSGNVRRSAQLAVGDAADAHFLAAKRWDLATIPSWRSNSNNSVVCDDTKELPELFWNGFGGNGEPCGLLNLALARRRGRTIETEPDRPDPGVKGTNPCAEIFLDNGETCCLSELFLPNIASKAELCRAAELVFTVCKAATQLKCHNGITEEVVRRNARIGVSVSGYLEATEEQRSWLPDCYEHLRAFDVGLCQRTGYPLSIRYTTVKPSGTLSLTAGILSPGCHPAYATYFRRNVRISTVGTRIHEYLGRHGYRVEPEYNMQGEPVADRVVVGFPVAAPAHAKVTEGMTAVEQLETVARLQREWSDNAVSVTVMYAKEELPAVREWLDKNYRDKIKSVSFLLRSDHGFKQAPLEALTKEEYEQEVARLAPIDPDKLAAAVLRQSTTSEMADAEDCTKGGCPVR